jgi:hypothetical protein
MQKGALKTSLLDANHVGMPERPTEEMVIADAKCMMQYVQIAAPRLRYPLFPETTDQSIAAIATKTIGKNWSQTPE